MEFIASAIQMRTLSSKRNENLKNALKLVERAAKYGAKLIVFPEYFITECPSIHRTHDELQKTTEEIPGGPIITEFCKKENLIYQPSWA